MKWGNNRSLDFSHRALVMGIINCTPDSFYPGSRVPQSADAATTARQMILDGVDILDIGGESTRPGSDPVDAEKEIRRVVPVIEAIRAESNILISIDTKKAAVARAAIEAGADIINDISALCADSGMAPLAASAEVPVVLMHMRGTPKDMQTNPYYDDAAVEVITELLDRVESAAREGIERDLIILDPGIGFGKRLEDNLELLRSVGLMREEGYPVLIGLSRKSFIDRVLQVPVEDRLAATLAAEAYAVMLGSDILRVHDVKETVHLVKMLDALGQARG
ncbi:MAG: dihydropteroate synthase [Spirochaetales bacterium]|nr:dihydropteroate synthase [Spirochaetales bacterium]